MVFIEVREFGFGKWCNPATTFPKTALTRIAQLILFTTGTRKRRALKAHGWFRCFGVDWFMRWP
jgi:hypothetical protein